MLLSGPSIALLITTLLAIWRIPAIREGALSFVPKMPRPLQFLPPLVLAMAAASGQGFLDGLRGEELLEATLLAGGQIGAESIAIWHTGKRIWALVKASPQTTTIVVLMGLASSTQACAGSFETARLRSPQVAQTQTVGASATSRLRCESLDDRQMWGSTAAIVFASASGVSGLSTVKVDDEDRNWRYGIATSAVLAAALAAGSEVYAQSARSSYFEEGCGR
jgi:hypothetical protein